MQELVFHIVQSVEKNKKQTVDEIVDQILTLEDGTKIIVMAPVIREKRENI